MKMWLELLFKPLVFVMMTSLNQLMLATGCRGQHHSTSAPISSGSALADANHTLTSSSLSSIFADPKMIPADFKKPLTDVDLLALKVDKSLMISLDQWLGQYGIQLPNSLIKTIEDMDLCPDKAADGLRHYCTKMPDGRYYDPWNPWCGYIVCRDGQMSRIVCQRGTWMGGSLDMLTNTMDSMCRRKLEDSQICSEQTDHLKLCRMANWNEAQDKP